MHVLDTADDHVPATQVPHVDALMAEYVPALQFVHTVVPAKENVPA